MIITCGHVPVRGRAGPSAARLKALLVDQRSQGELFKDSFRFREFWQLFAWCCGDEEGAKSCLRDAKVASLKNAESDLNLLK